MTFRSAPAWPLAVLLLLSGSLGAAQPTIQIGFNFLDPGQSAPIDFLNILDLKVHMMEPWPLVDPASPFVTQGAFQGMTEQEVRDRIVQLVRKKFYAVPAPPGRELNIDLYSRPVSGPGTINVAFGRYNHDLPGDHWFGQADLGEAMDEPTGKTMAVVAVDEIGTLPGPFDTPGRAFNALVNVTAHEIGHLFGLRHVCTIAECGDCAGSGNCTPVTDPYDVMATGPSGLPDDGWLLDNPFTSVPHTQLAGRSSVQTLLVNAGTRLIGDVDLDEDVDSADLAQVVVRWTGALDYNLGDRLWADGDFDHDQDVDSVDMTTVVQSWSGSAAMASTLPPPALNYDPNTGSLAIETGENQEVASFVLTSEQGAFATDKLQLPWSEEENPTDALASQIGQFRMSGNAGPGIYDLGPVLPAGLSAEQLQTTVTSAEYAWVGGGGGAFTLVVVPEPASCLLLWMAMGLWARYRRRGGR